MTAEAQRPDYLNDLATLYNEAPVGLVTTTLDGRIVEANRTAMDWLGRTRESLIGSTFDELLDIGSRLFYETRHAPLLRLQGSVREVALTLTRSDGTALPILMNAVVTPDGEFVRVAIFDATARQEYERELLNARRAAEASEQRVRVLQDASMAFGSMSREEDLVETVAASARDAFSASAAAVMLVDERGELRLAAGRSPVAEVMGVEVSPTAIEALGGTGVLTIRSLDEAESTRPALVGALRTARIEAMSIAPLLHEGRALGVMACYFSRQRDFDERALDLQEALARQAAQVLVRVRLQRELEVLATYDQLTGVVNRAVLEDLVSKAIVSSQQNQLPMAVIFLDLDGFKEINDHMGHTVGDSVLQQVAARLRTGVRHGDSVGRFGGDEFVAVCEDASAADAMSIAERIIEAVREPLDGVPDHLGVTASVGVTIYDPCEHPLPTGDDLLNLADDAMYRAKAAGKNRVTLALHSSPDE